ncbi:hypothetical protein SRABI128_03109 [Microbacterium sp. Bi128]|nr:hypothetical protein SRABI128_03109 [Microbacterium sp. Bi128]
MSCTETGCPVASVVTGRVRAGSPATLTKLEYGAYSTCIANVRSGSWPAYQPTGRGDCASAGVSTASNAAKSAIVRRSNARAADSPPSRSTADSARPSRTSHAVSGSTSVMSSSLKGMRAALARHSTRNSDA